MLRLFLRVVAAFALLVGLFLLIGCFIPRGYDIETSVVIDASPAEVFPWINRLENWEKWSPISEERISSLTTEYSGEKEGVGAIQTWTESRGEGKMWITESRVNELIEYDWRFSNFPDLHGTFVLETPPDDNSKCTVSWRSAGQLPAGPFYGYLSVIFESAMTAEYQKCLDLLKKAVEETAG